MDKVTQEDCAESTQWDEQRAKDRTKESPVPLQVWHEGHSPQQVNQELDEK